MSIWRASARADPIVSRKSPGVSISDQDLVRIKKEEDVAEGMGLIGKKILLQEPEFLSIVLRAYPLSDFSQPSDWEY